MALCGVCCMTTKINKNVSDIAVKFYWKPNGDLGLDMNGESVITTRDTTYSPNVKSLSIFAYMNNNSVLGLTLQLDNNTLDSVPAGAAEFGDTNCVINEHPTVADIVPADDG